jgi:predicted porin
MQKKIIALAVAGLASTAAFAQSNVTVYGVVDYGYAYRTDAITPALGVSKPSSSSQINGGQQSGNRLGFKGVEDLGNGLKAVFQLEAGFLLDTGRDHAAGSMFSRQAYAGLTGGFGTLIGGRLYTPHYSFVSSVDPFGNGTVGQYSNTYGGGLFDPVRVNNAVAYVSPSFGGLTITGAYSNSADTANAGTTNLAGTTIPSGQDSLTSNAQNNSVYAILARYNGAGIDLGLNYHYIAAGSNGVPTIGGLDTVKSVQNITLGGSYDAKVVKIAGWYSNSIQDNATGFSDVKIDNWMIGATVPVGKFAIKASYNLSDGNSAAGGNAQQYAIGTDYSLSKRTNLYTAYAMIDNDSATNNRVTTRRATVVGDGSNGGGTFQTGFNVGLRHQF